MRITFWGVRGSIPAPISPTELKAKITRILVDANGFIEKKPPIHILMSHTHWDHINAFPFSTPVYMPGSSITVYGCQDDLETQFRSQNHPYNFRSCSKTWPPT